MQEMKFYIGDYICYGKLKGKILDITDFLGIFAEFEESLMTKLGFKTNRVWLENNILNKYEPEYGIEQFGMRTDQPFVKLRFQ